MNNGYQPSTATQSLHASVDGGTDEGLAERRNGVRLNNARQSVFAHTIHTAQDMSFELWALSLHKYPKVSHGSSAGSERISQSISANNVDIQGSVKYETTNNIYGSQHSTIASWLLSLSSLRFEEKQRQYYQIAKEAPGTGQWLLDSREFTDWRDGALRKLWCKGIPGAGKTVLASIIINYLLAGYAAYKNIACIYVYFDYKEQKKQDLTNILSSLLAQLVRIREPIHDETEVIHQYWTSKRTDLSSEEYILMLISQTKSFSKVYIVVDALDECLDDIDTNTRNRFLKALDELPQQVHILYTSRPINSIGQKIQADRELEIVANGDDLRKYFDSRIKNVDNLKALVDVGVKKDSQFLKKVLNTIVTRCQGMFLLAQFHIAFLASQYTLLDFQDGVDHLPLTTDEVYRIALDRIRGQSWHKRELAIHVLTWLVFAKRTLTIAELKDTIPSQIYDENMPEERFVVDLTSACAGVVIADNGANVARLAHYTAEEYLRKNKSSIFHDAQSKMAQTCLVYLSYQEFSHVPNSEKDVEDRPKAYPFLRYAADHWGDHVSSGVRGPVYKLAWEFLSDGPRLRSALQVMNTLRHEEDVSSLHVAAYFGLDKLMEKVIKQKKGFTLNAQTQRGETALHWAAFYGRTPFLKLLIDQGADLNVTDKDGKTALQKATINGDVESVEILLSLPGRADLQLKDSRGWTPLWWAADHGQIRIVELLLENGAEVDAQDMDGWTVLRWAAQKGHKRIIEELMRKGASAEPPSSDGWTLLSWAAQEGQESFIRLLIENQVNLDAINSKGWTALRWAIEYGHGMTAWLLIQAGADIDKPDNEGKTPLHSATERWSEFSDKSLIWLLLEKNADVNARTKGLHLTALHIAAAQGHTSVLWLLLERGADVNAQSKSGLTALHTAASKGHGSAVSLLLEKGADIKSRTKPGLTALHTAASEGHGPVVSLLLEKGADIKSRTKPGLTALHTAASEGNGPVVSLLLEKGAEINEQTKHRLTALHIAASQGQNSVVSLLLQKGAHSAQVDNNERTALHCAVTEGHESVAQLLLQHTESLVDAIDDEKRTVLHVAASAGNLPIVKLLVDGRAKIDIRDREGYTPLHRAVFQQHEDVVLFLVRRGANVNIPNRKQWTALHSAAYTINTKILKTVLQSAGADLTVKNNEGYTPWELAKNQGHNIEKF